MDDHLRARLRRYFDEAARDYVTAMEPALAPLVDRLLDVAELHPGERVIDLGAGTGLVSRGAARRGAVAVVLDFSRTMLQAARLAGASLAVQADLHALCMANNIFDVALAALALNSTDPLRSLAEAHRVLRPGARLLVLEWGTVDALSELLDDTLADYAVDDPPPWLGARRTAQREPHPWDALETSDDVVEALQQAGFTTITTSVETPDVMLPGPETFIRYKLAWPIRAAEVRAMSADVRSLFMSDLEENFTAQARPDGTFIWQPNIIIFEARKPRSGIEQ